MNDEAPRTPTSQDAPEERGHDPARLEKMLQADIGDEEPTVPRLGRVLEELVSESDDGKFSQRGAVLADQAQLWSWCLGGRHERTDGANPYSTDPAPGEAEQKTAMSHDAKVQSDLNKIVEIVWWMRYLSKYAEKAEPDFRTSWKAKRAQLAEIASRFLGDMNEDTVDQGGSTVETPPKQRLREVWLAHAMQLVEKHPEWSDAAVAREVGVHRGTLARSKWYQSAAGLARGERSMTPGHIEDREEPGTGGSVEAYDSTGDPAEMDWDD